MCPNILLVGLLLAPSTTSPQNIIASLPFIPSARRSVPSTTSSHQLARDFRGRNQSVVFVDGIHRNFTKYAQFERHARLSFSLLAQLPFPQDLAADSPTLHNCVFLSLPKP
jgi:hypothetical protein